ncbi:MAG: patatin-like phospholipase family protein [Phaeodactylibacter sp.]|nr:patatin-like phospholipase family protein [Phaeodactylibacter sp.]
MKRSTQLLIFLLVITIYFRAQSQELPHRPKVGLVLSGGAAKGMAHVGVLKVLEEVGIQPDIITGTSMGSIIGGLYAIGYRADTLEKLLLGLDWDRALSDRIDLQSVLFEEKNFFENQILQLSIEDGKIQAPSGLIRGQQILSLLTRLSLPAYRIEDFRQLPIPFRCVVADVISAEHLTLDRGCLPEAMRASMSIPSAFTPIRGDSTIFIDGGIIRNFPVEEAKEWGADIIIGVYTGRLKPDKEELNNLSDILIQAGFLMSIRDAEAQLPLVDIYIEPDLRAYKAQDFKKADSIIVCGERAGRLQFDKLKALADSLQKLGPPYPHPALPAVDSLCIDHVVIEGNKRFNVRELQGTFGIDAGSTVHVDDIEQGVSRLYGTNAFEQVSYRLQQVDGRTVLSLKCLEKAPTVLRAAVNFDKYLGAGFLFNISARNFLRPASRLMFTGTIAENYRFGLNYLKYLGKPQLWAAVLATQVSRDEIPVFQNGRQNETFQLTEWLVDLRLQKRLGNNGMTGLGLQREQLSFKPIVSSDPTFRRLDYTNYNLYGFLQLNSLNRNILPQSGTYLSLEFKGIYNNSLEVRTRGLAPGISPDSLFAFTPYTKLTFHSKSYYPIHQRASITVSPFAGFVFNPSNTFGDFYLIGAPEMLTRRSIPFYGLNANQLVSQVAFGIGAGYQHFLRDNLMFSIDANAGFFARPDLLANSAPQPEQFLAGLGLTGGYQSFLGPVKFTLMYPIDTDGSLPRNLRYFLTIGHRF